MTDPNEHSDEQPEIYALKKDREDWQFSRRSFLAASGATMAVLAAGCAPVQRTPRATATPTVTPTDVPTETPTPEPTPTPTPEDIVQSCETLIAHEAAIKSLAIHPQSWMLASGGEDYVIKIWFLPGGEYFKTLENYTTPSSLVFTPDASLLISNGEDPSIRLWSMPLLEDFQTLDGHNDQVADMVVTADGSMLISGGLDDQVIFWSLPAGELLTTLSGDGNGFFKLAISPDGKTLAAGTFDGIKLWSLPEGELIKSFGAGHFDTDVDCMAFDHEGKLLFTNGTADGSVYAWSLPDAELVDDWQAHDLEITAMAIHPDGTLLATSSADMTIRLWSLPDKTLSKVLHGHGGQINQLIFSPDGKMLISASEDQKIMVWSIPEGTMLSCPMDLSTMGEDTEGIQYETTNSQGETVIYSLPCGSPIPANAVCTCNCVSGEGCSCVGYTSGGSDGGGGTIGGHYWYPD